MALGKEQYEKILRILEETSAVSQMASGYPDEIRAYRQLAEVEQLDMCAEGHHFTLYQCSAKEKPAGAPLFINIHGGGWYLPHKENDIYFSCWLADKIKGVVLSIDYTTSKDAPWEVMFGQCYHALAYGFDHALSLGCDPNRISLGGYSAGGHLAAGLALKVAQTGAFKLKQQIICYAPLDMKEKENTEPESELEKRIQKRGSAFLDLLFRREKGYYELLYANPQIADDEILSKLPPTLIITAGKCGFRFEDEAYGLRIAASGVETTIRRFPEAFHGFIPHFMECWEPAACLMAKKIMEL